MYFQQFKKYGNATKNFGGAGRKGLAKTQFN